MTTYTLTGDLGDLIGDDPELIAARLALVNAPYAVEAGEVRFPVVRLTLDEAGTFTQEGVPGSETGYQYQVIAEYAPSEPGMGNEIITIGPFDMLADTDLGDVAAVEFNPITRPSLNHGVVSGAVALSAAFGVHAMTLSGNVVLAPSGQEGADLTVFVNPNSHTVTLDGAGWFGPAPTLDDGLTVLTFVHSPYGWYVFRSAGTGDPVPVWTTVATDTFTGANGADLNTRAADTGQSWTMSGGTLEIQSNKLDNLSGHGFAPEGLLALGAAYPDGVRSTVDYIISSVSGVAVGSNYASTTYGGDYPFGIRVNADGTLATQAAGVDSLSLTGTTTGHPTTGTLAVKCVGTAITVYINGIAVATATLPGTLTGTKGWLQLLNADSLADNFMVEGLV